MSETNDSPPQAAKNAACHQRRTKHTAATAATSVQVSDAEVDQFAKATVKVQKIDADAKLDSSAKQTKMAAAVKDVGLEPARYNEIAKAIPTDDALRTKVQVAMAKYAKASPTKG